MQLENVEMGRIVIFFDRFCVAVTVYQIKEDIHRYITAQDAIESDESDATTIACNHTATALYNPMSRCLSSRARHLMIDARCLPTLTVLRDLFDVAC
jgi:hypothetical protein